MITLCPVNAMINVLNMETVVQTTIRCYNTFTVLFLIRIIKYFVRNVEDHQEDLWVTLIFRSCQSCWSGDDCCWFLEMYSSCVSLDTNNAGSMIDLNWGCTTNNGNTQVNITFNISQQQIETYFENGDLKCKPNYWFRKSHPRLSWTEFCFDKVIHF